MNAISNKFHIQYDKSNNRTTKEKNKIDGKSKTQTAPFYLNGHDSKTNLTYWGCNK